MFYINFEKENKKDFEFLLFWMKTITIRDFDLSLTIFSMQNAGIGRNLIHEEDLSLVSGWIPTRNCCYHCLFSTPKENKKKGKLENL